ncbi:MAG: hypothetical protein ACK4OM_01355 [Alphaproteobacteria bacterium]
MKPVDRNKPNDFPDSKRQKLSGNFEEQSFLQDSLIQRLEGESLDQIIKNFIDVFKDDLNSYYAYEVFGNLLDKKSKEVLELYYKECRSILQKNSYDTLLPILKFLVCYKKISPNTNPKIVFDIWNEINKYLDYENPIAKILSIELNCEIYKNYPPNLSEDRIEGFIGFLNDASRNILAVERNSLYYEEYFLLGYNLIGDFYTFNHKPNYSKAISYYSKTIELLQDLKNKNRITIPKHYSIILAKAYIGLAYNHASLTEYETCINYTLKSINKLIFISRLYSCDLTSLGSSFNNQLFYLRNSISALDAIYKSLHLQEDKNYLHISAEISILSMLYANYAIEEKIYNILQKPLNDRTLLSTNKKPELKFYFLPSFPVKESISLAIKGFLDDSWKHLSFFKKEENSESKLQILLIELSNQYSSPNKNYILLKILGNTIKNLLSEVVNYTLSEEQELMVQEASSNKFELDFWKNTQTISLYPESIKKLFEYSFTNDHPLDKDIASPYLSNLNLVQIGKEDIHSLKMLCLIKILKINEATIKSQIQYMDDDSKEKLCSEIMDKSFTLREIKRRTTNTEREFTL